MGGEDEGFWLVPIEDRRASGGRRIGISPRMDLAAYLRLLDWSSRLLRPGKCRVQKEVTHLLTRLGSSAEVWKFRLEKLQAADRLFGTVFATKRGDINRFAEARGMKKLSNLNGCPG